MDTCRLNYPGNEVGTASWGGVDPAAWRNERGGLWAPRVMAGEQGNFSDKTVLEEKHRLVNLLKVWGLMLLTEI